MEEEKNFSRSKKDGYIRTYYLLRHLGKEDEAQKLYRTYGFIRRHVDVTGQESDALVIDDRDDGIALVNDRDALEEARYRVAIRRQYGL